MQFEFHQAVWFFWFLPLLFVVFLLVERRRVGILSRFVSRAEAAEKLPEYAPLGTWFQCACFLAALAFLGVALLKPYSGFEEREIARKGVDLFFLVDVSPSMLAQDVSPGRIDRARFELKDFLGELTGDRVGLVGFSGESFTLVPLTGDYKAFGLFLNELDPDLFPVAGTDIPGAIGKAVESFKKQDSGSGKAIILITDGEDSVGLDASVIDDIKRYGVKVFVIGVGTPEGAPIPEEGGGYKTDAAGNVVVTKLNEPALQELAVATGGGYVRSISGDLDLKQIYGQGIKRAFEEAEYAKSRKKLPHYRFQWAILAGLVCLLLETFFSKRRGFLWRTVVKLSRRRRTVGSAAFLLCALNLAAPVQAANPFALERGDKAFEEERYDEALNTYSELKRSDPNDPVLDYDLGSSYYKLGRYAEAEEAFKKSLNLPDPQDRKKALYNLGNTAFRKQSLEEALSYYEKALQIDPDYQNARANYDFVKEVLERQKEEQKQNQENQDQKEKSDQQQEQREQEKKQQQDQENQVQQDQQQTGQQEREDQSKGNDEKQDGERKEKEEDSLDREQDEEKRDQDPGEEKKEDKKEENTGEGKREQDESKKPESTSSGGEQSTEGKFDNNADQWLESVSDEPGQAMKYLIQKNSVEKTKRFDKDW